MRVALVVTGGVDRSGRDRVTPVLLWLIERLARRHTLHVYAVRYLAQPCSYPLLGAMVHDLGRPEGLRRQYNALQRALQRDGPFDIIHGHWALPSGLLAAAAGRRLRIPSLVTLDSGEFAAIPEIGYGLQLRRRHRFAVAATVRLAHRATVCTQFQRDLARAHGVIADVIPMGIDAQVFTRAEISDGPPWRLLQVANLNPVKDQPTLLRAFRRLADRVPEVHLDIVGIDTLSGMMQEQAQSLGLARQVTFHGFQPTDALVKLYQQAHVCVLASRHEAAGVVMLEAAACGVPTVGSHVGYLADWTPDRAVTIPPGDSDALSEAIADVLVDRPRRERLAYAAREWTLAHDADWTAGQFDRVYRDLVER